VSAGGNRRAEQAQIVNLKITTFVLAAAAWLTANRATGQQPDSTRAVKIPLSRIAQMAIGFEFRQPWNPYWKIRDQSHQALVGKFLRTREKSNDDAFGATEFEIIEVYRNKDDDLAKGKIIVFPWRIEGNPGDLFGLYTSTHQGNAWLVPEKIDQTIAAYFASIPSDPVERLNFFLRQIESRKAAVAFDAYTGLEQTPIRQFVALRGQLPITQLRNRLLSFAVGPFDDEPTEVYSFQEEIGSGLLVTLARIVGACGTPEDAAALERHIRKGSCFRRDALTAAYLVLQGEPGMDRLEQDIHNQRAAKVGNAAEVLDLLAATELLCLYDENPIPRQRAVELAVSALANPETAAGAVHALATWKEWKIMDQVTELFQPRLNNYSETRKAIVFYLLCAAEDKSSPYAVKASQSLNVYKRQHPDAFDAAKASLDSMDPAWRQRSAAGPLPAPKPAAGPAPNGASSPPAP
jgi:hypothetical protein